MRLVLQRVSQARVTVEGKVTGEIAQGLLVLLGARESDDFATADAMLQKMAGLRIFSDAQDKMNLCVTDIGGGVLVVPNFTLYADCRKGRRPSFTGSGSPAHAERLYAYFIEQCKAAGIAKVQSGIFGADMKVELINDGPVTILLDSDELLPKKNP